MMSPRLLITTGRPQWRNPAGHDPESGGGVGWRLRKGAHVWAVGVAGVLARARQQQHRSPPSANPGLRAPSTQTHRPPTTSPLHSKAPLAKQPFDSPSDGTGEP